MAKTFFPRRELSQLGFSNVAISALEDVAEIADIIISLEATIAALATAVADIATLQTEVAAIEVEVDELPLLIPPQQSDAGNALAVKDEGVIITDGATSLDFVGTLLAGSASGTDVTLTTAVSAASRLIGRGSAGGAGVTEEITLGTGLSMTGTVLASTSLSTTLTDAHILVGNVSNVATDVPMTGDVTISNAGVTAIGANKVTDAIIRQSAGLSVIGRSANTTGNVADITATATGQVLRYAGTTLAFGAVDLTDSDAVTGALTVTNGGSGAATFTAHSLLLGQTTSAITALGAATNGQLPIGSTGADPVLAAITAGTGITVTNGAGSISIASTGATIPTSGLIAPQGRLTLVTGVPVMVSDQSAKTHVYYTPQVGSTIPIYDGSAWGLQTISADLDLTLDTTNQLLENVYDFFVWNNSSVISIGAGPAWVNTATVTWTSASPGVCSWTSHGLYEGAPVIFTAGTSTPTGITAGTTYYVSKTGLTASAFSVSTTVANAEAGTNVNTSSTGTGTQTGTNHTTKRGTGAGTTEIARLNGLWTNANSITLYNNAVSSGSIAANKATYVGSGYMSANGQISQIYAVAAASGGPSTAPILGLYNAYNREEAESIARDAKTTWTPATTGWRAMDQSTKNRVYWLDGLQQSTPHANLGVTANGQTGAAAVGMGVGWNTSSVNPGISAIQVQTSQLNISLDTTSTALLGMNYAQAMEYAVGGAGIAFSGNPTGALQTQQLLLRISM